MTFGMGLVALLIKPSMFGKFLVHAKMSLTLHEPI
jgi:hypothetical protein